MKDQNIIHNLIIAIRFMNETNVHTQTHINSDRNKFIFILLLVLLLFCVQSHSIKMINCGNVNR